MRADPAAVSLHITTEIYDYIFVSVYKYNKMN